MISKILPRRGQQVNADTNETTNPTPSSSNGGEKLSAKNTDLFHKSSDTAPIIAVGEEERMEMPCSGALPRRVEDDTHHQALYQEERTTTDDDAIQSSAEKWQRRRTLGVYLLTITILYADLALMAPNLSEIADEFGFDDNERDIKLGGYMALGFFTLSFPAALLIGWLADFWNRSPLFAVTVLLGESACLGTYFVETYPQLFVTRLLTGISISGSLPVIFSILGDLYPNTQRNAVAAIVTTGTGMGTGIGQALAGFLGPTYGWRFPFLVVSIPGILCSFLLLCIKDPPRGQKEAARVTLDQAIERHHRGECLQGQHQHNNCDRTTTSGTDVENIGVVVQDYRDNLDADYQEHPASSSNKATHEKRASGQPSEPIDNLLFSQEENTTNAGTTTLANTSMEKKNQDSSADNNKFTSTDLAGPGGRGSEIVVGLRGSSNSRYIPSKGTNEIKDRDVNTVTTTQQNVGREEIENKVSWKTTKEMITTPTVALLFLGSAPGALPFGFASVFLNDYLAEDRGMTVEEATGALVTFGAGNALGVISSGIFGHYAYKKDVRLPPAIMGTALLLSCLPMYFLINWVDSDSSVGLVAIISLLAGYFSVLPVPIERAILTNVTVPSSRGRANSLLGIIDDLGKGLGPALVSILIQAFDRPFAFNISLFGWVLGGITSFAMCCFVRQDEELTQKRIREVIIREEGLNELLRFVAPTSQ